MVTNLFKPLSRPTGEFFLFSNYADDLTQQATNPKSYRVVPSKFAALQLDTTQVSEDYDSQIGLGIGDVLQDYYENKSNFLHTYDFTDTSIPYYKWWDSRIIWQTLLKFGLISTEQYTPNDPEEKEFYYFPELHYIGDVNIYSTSEVDGRAYNEIYCYIPNDAQDTRYAVHNIGENEESLLYTDVPGTEDTTDPDHPVTTLIGWNHQNYPSNLDILNAPILDNDDPEEYNIYDDNYWLRPDTLACEWTNGVADFDDHSTDLHIADDTVNMFEVNAVLVFYDVISINDEGTETVKYKNLPLGIYFTGYDPEHGLSNVIQKYVNSDDIYQQGTSYGLRICNRFVSTPNATTFYDTNIDIYDGLADFSHAMQMMGDNAALMQDIAQQNETTYNDLNDHLAQFKNYRTNVPYIRQLTINGDQVGVWFVNGRNTGQIAGTYVNRTTQADWECEDEDSPAYIQHRPDMVSLRGIVMADAGDEEEILTPENNKGLGIEAGVGVRLRNEHRTATQDIPYDYESIVISCTGGGGSDILKVETTPIHTFDDHSSVLFMSNIPYDVPKPGEDQDEDPAPKAGYPCIGNQPGLPRDSSNTSLYDFEPGNPILYYTVQVPESDEWVPGKRYRIAVQTDYDRLIKDLHTLVLRFNNHNILVNSAVLTPEVEVEDESLIRIINGMEKTLYTNENTLGPLILYLTKMQFDDFTSTRAKWPPDIVYFDITFITEERDGVELLSKVLLDMGWGNSGDKNHDPQVYVDVKTDPVPVIPKPK